MKQNLPEFVTQFNKEMSLTSSGHASAFMYPRPYGAFIQSKDTRIIEQLWQYHSEGEQFLLETYPIKIDQTSVGAIEDGINQWVVKQGTYISQIPCYWLYAPYWFYIKRFKMLNVSIQKQLAKT